MPTPKDRILAASERHQRGEITSEELAGIVAAELGALPKTPDDLARYIADVEAMRRPTPPKSHETVSHPADPKRDPSA